MIRKMLDNPLTQEWSFCAIGTPFRIRYVINFNIRLFTHRLLDKMYYETKAFHSIMRIFPAAMQEAMKTFEAQHNVHSDMCAEGRLKSVCATAQFNQSHRCTYEEILHPWLSTNAPNNITKICLYDFDPLEPDFFL